MDFETQTDIIILLENIRCQTADSSCQKQGLVALAAILNLDEECQNYFREAGGVDEITAQLLDDRYELPLVPVALFCLASAIEDNAISKLDVLSSDLLSHIHLRFVSMENKECVQSAAFFLACLVNGNVKAQCLAYRSGCVEDLLKILRELVQHECKDENQWKMISRSIHACISNPQNETNQRVSSCIIPHLLKVVTEWSDGNIVQHALSTIGLVMHSNASNQKLFKSCGGIDTLAFLVTKSVARFEEDTSASGHDVLMSAITTLDFSVADNQQNAARAIDVGLVPQILSLFQHGRLNSGDKTFPLMVLVHIMEHTDLPVDPSTVTLCQRLMTKLLTDTNPTQDKEILKLVKYILALCKDKSIENDNNNQQHLKKDSQRNRSHGFQNFPDREEMPQSAFNNVSKRVASGHQLAQSYENIFCNSADEKESRNGNNITNVEMECPKNQTCSYDNGDVYSKFSEIFNKHKEKRFLSEVEAFNLYRKHNANSVVDNDNVDEKSNEQSLDTNLNEVNKFVNGMENNNSEVPTMLALMTLQDKQIQMFSEIQNLINEIKFPMQQVGGKRASHSPTKSSPQSSLKHHGYYELGQNKNIGNGGRILEADHRLYSSCLKDLQNIPQISDKPKLTALQARGGNNVGKLSSKQKQPSLSQALHCGMMNYESLNEDKMSHTKSRIQRSAKSNSSFRMISDNNSNYVDAGHKKNAISSFKNTLQCSNSNQKEPHSKTNGETYSRRRNDFCGGSDSNRSIMSSSTVDYTQSLKSDLDKLMDSPSATRFSPRNRKEGRKNESSLVCKSHDKTAFNSRSTQSLSYMCSSKDSNRGKEKNYCKRLNKFPQSEYSEPSQRIQMIRDGKKGTSKTLNGTQNIRKAKSIRSIQLTAQTDVLGEDAVTLPPSLYPPESLMEKQIPKPNQNLNKAYESALKALSVSDIESLPGRRTCKVNNRSGDFMNQEKSRSSGKKQMEEDMDSCFGHDSDNFNMSKIGRSQETGVYRNNLHNYSIRSNSKCRSPVDKQTPKSNGLSRREDQAKATAACDSVSGGTGAKERKECIVPSPYTFKPQPISLLTKNVRKRMPSATIDYDREMRTKEISGSKRQCKEGSKSIEVKDEDQKMSNESCKDKPILRTTPMSELKDVKKLEDVYAFVSSSEKPKYSSCSESGFSTGSLLHTVNRRAQRQNGIYANTRRSRVPYSDQEILNLRHGVANLGTRWQQIVAIYQFHPSRNAVDLKEKFKRLMEPSKPKNDNRDRKCEVLPFSAEEIRRLKRGVKMFGHNWKAILAGERFLPGRSHQDLRNKWTTLSRMLSSDAMTSLNK